MTMVDNYDVVQNAPINQRVSTKGEMGHIIPRFYEITTKTDQIDENGLPVFKTQEYVELLIAGDKGNAPTKRVNQAIKDQFHEAYSFWKAKKTNPDMIGDGIPLSLWPVVPTEMVKALEYINVFTVQQLANLSESAISKPGAIGLRDMREKAKAFIESAKSMAPIAALEKENSDLRKRLDLMQAQMNQLLEAAPELAEKSANKSSQSKKLKEQ